MKRLPRSAARAAICLSLCLLAACDSGSRSGPTPCDSGLTVDGLDLSEYAGKVVVLNFWATWCGPCRIEIPALVKLRRDFSEEDVAVIGVSVDAQQPGIEQRLQRFGEALGVNYPMFHDYEQDFAAQFDPTGVMRFVPTTILLDGKCRIHDTHFGVPRDRNGRTDPYRVLAGQVQYLLDGS